MELIILKTKKKPLNFDSADEYLSYKRRLLDEKDEEEQKKNPTFNVYSFYFSYLDSETNRRRVAKPINIAAETQYEAEQIFEIWAEFHSIKNVSFRNITEVFWVTRSSDTASQNINFAYDYGKKEITEVYQDDYLEWYWNHVDTWNTEGDKFGK